MTLIRTVIVSIWRGQQYRSFYRERPGAANLSMLSLEWANLAVSSLFVVLRVSFGLVIPRGCVVAEIAHDIHFTFYTCSNLCPF